MSKAERVAPRLQGNHYFPRPRLLRVCQRFESHSVVSLQKLAVHPLILVLGAHPPSPLGWGCAPSTPSFCPPSFAESLPKFWVPLGGRFKGVSSSPLLICGSTPPKPPGKGLHPFHLQFLIKVGLCCHLAKGAVELQKFVFGEQPHSPTKGINLP